MGENINDSMPIITMSSENLFMVVIRFMNLAETMHNASSMDKKKFVETALEVHMGTDGFERYGPLLDVMIDGIVSMTRKDLTIFVNRSKKCIFKCLRI
jgi:hypothetical protein